MNAPIADSAVTRRHPPLDGDAFDALLAQLTNEFAASAAHHDRTAEFPHANLARLHEFDLLSLTVPAALGGAGASLPQALKGFAQWAVDRAPGNLGAPLSSLPAFQQTLGRIDALLFSNRVLLDASARAEHVTLDEAPLVKYTVTNQAIEAVQLAIEASGNPGLSRDNPLERHYRDVLCARIHTPQNDSVLQAAGRAGFASISRG